MNDSYRLSKLDTYYAPSEGNINDTKNYIEGLPLDEDPEVFGLHPNANIAYEKNLVNLLSDTVLMMQPRVSSSGGGKTSDERAQDLCREIAAKVPPSLDKDKAHSTTFAISSSGAMVSLGVFLGQEIDRFNALLKTMRFTLDQLDKAIQGTVVMSAALEEMAGKFLLNKVPTQWENVAYPCLKPLSSWVEDLIRRVEFLGKWLYNGLPDTYWVSSFFFPQGFMTAAL
jgi:dynein heavy chain